MRIVVLSDTHMPRKAKTLPGLVLTALADADHIIHAGDITAPEVLVQLATVAPVTAVAGNTDTPELQMRLGNRTLLRLSRYMIGICHGHGKGGTTLQRAVNTFAGESVDAIVFGHSHMAYCAFQNDMLLLNPGSPTDKRRSPYYSFGILEIGETLTARLVYFDFEGREVVPQ